MTRALTRFPKYEHETTNQQKWEEKKQTQRENSEKITIIFNLFVA